MAAAVVATMKNACSYSNESQAEAATRGGATNSGSADDSSGSRSGTGSRSGAAVEGGGVGRSHGGGGRSHESLVHHSGGTSRIGGHQNSSTTTALSSSAMQSRELQLLSSSYADPFLSAAANANHSFSHFPTTGTRNVPHYLPSGTAATQQYLFHPSSLVLAGAGNHLGVANLAQLNNSHFPFGTSFMGNTSNMQAASSLQQNLYGAGAAANHMFAGGSGGALFGGSFALQLAATERLLNHQSAATTAASQQTIGAAMFRSEHPPERVLSSHSTDNSGPSDRTSSSASSNAATSSSRGSFLRRLQGNQNASEANNSTRNQSLIGNNNGNTRSRSNDMTGLVDGGLEGSLPADRPVKRARVASKGRTFPLYLDSDEQNLSHYQCLARQQMELFETTDNEAGSNAQGRNRPIVSGQVGIRCKHCALLPRRQRKTGSVYYPSRLDGVYQTAQKITVGHLCHHCQHIPNDVRDKLLLLKDQKSSDGGGKRYWAEGVRSYQVYETGTDGLALRGD